MDTKVRSEASAQSSTSGALRRRRGLAWLSQFLAPVLGARAEEARPSRKDHLAFEALEPRILLDGTPVVPATRIEGSIDVAGETDRYGFSLTSDARVVFDSLTNTGNLNWSLSGPRGTVVNSRPFSGSDSNSAQASPVLELASGNYTLSVDGVADATGSYAFRLIDLSTANLMTPEVPVSGNLDPANETDVFAFDAQAGERYLISRGTNPSVAGYWRLIDPLGVQVVKEGWDLNSFDTGVLTTGGRYSLLLEGSIDASSAVPYGFRLLKAGQDVAALGIGETVSGNLPSAARSARYDFSLASAGQFYFDGLTNDSRLSWSLRGPLGTTVSGQSFTSWGAGLYDQQILALGAGNYSLTVQASGDFSGDFGFRLLDLSAATAVDFGTPIAGQLDPAAGAQAYRFTAAAGDRVAFQQIGTNPAQTLYWRVLDPGGRQVLSYNYFGGYTDLPVLAVDGAYTLIVDGPLGNTGSVDFGFRLVHPTVSTTAIAVGDLVADSIATAGQVQRYTFDVAADTVLAFDSLASDGYLNWALYDGDGYQIDGRNFTWSDGASANGELISVTTGQYTLVVDPDGASTGSYAFRLLDMAGATPIALGDAFPVQLLQSGRETRAFAFDAQSGDHVTLNLDYVSGDGSTILQLFDPFGRRVARAGTGQTPLRLEQTGRYTLLVEGYIYSGADSVYNVFLDLQSNDGGNALPAGTPIAVGDTVTGTLDASATPVVYNFALASDATLLLDALGAEEYSLSWSLSGPRGSETTNQYFYSSDGGYPYYGVHPLRLAAGEYALTLRGSSAQAYAFRLVDLAAHLVALTEVITMHGADLFKGSLIEVILVLQPAEADILWALARAQALPRGPQRGSGGDSGQENKGGDASGGCHG